METFQGTIIEESLSDSKILKQFNIIATNIEKVTPEDGTPWISQWTMHTISISADLIEQVAVELSHSLDSAHPSSWYIDFKSEKRHFVIYPNKVFQIDRNNAAQYQEATKYGISIGIPAQQVDFAAAAYQE